MLHANLPTLCSSRIAYIVQFVVESACVADRLAVVVSPPQRRLRRLAVGARGALAAGSALKEE
jgi:hypothetical protein